MFRDEIPYENWPLLTLNIRSLLSNAFLINELIADYKFNFRHSLKHDLILYILFKVISGQSKSHFYVGLKHTLNLLTFGPYNDFYSSEKLCETFCSRSEK